MKKYYLALSFLITIQIYSQVGINTTSPNAQLDIRSSNQATPSNTDGILIPKVNTFPAINPTVTQQGMLVYLTTATTFSGNPKPIGFYYWNDSPADWIAVKGTDGGTLDQAYDFGGSGLGRIITADSGAVLINGTDGLVSTGTSGSGVVTPSGSGVRMVWNPRKSAFRAGTAFGTTWDDVNIGVTSAAFGFATRASGATSTSFGFSTTASGDTATAFGFAASASGDNATAFGNITNASGNTATAFGAGTLASAGTATAFGESTTASGARSTAFGFGSEAAGFNATAFGEQTFATGQNATAFGNTTTASGNRATAFGRGNTASGITSTAFGEFNTASGNISTAFGNGALASGILSTAFGQLTNAIGNNTTAFGMRTTASGVKSTVFGTVNIARSFGETAIGIGSTNYSITANGDSQFRTANATDRLFVIGNAIDTNNNDTVDLTELSDALVILKNGNTGIGSSIPIERMHVAGKSLFTNGFSADNAALIYRNNTDYMFLGPQSGSSANGGTMALFGSTNVSAGNAGGIDLNVLSGQLRITSAGNVGIGSSTPQEKLHIVGNLRMVDGNQGAGKVLTSDINGTATWQNTSNNAWGLTGNSGLNATTNFIGTSDDVDVVFKRNDIRSGLFGITNSSFGLNALNIASTGTNNTAIGVEALQINTTGSNNTAVGFNAFATINQGSNNTGIGVDTATTSTLTSNATAIGYKATVGVSNCVVLGSVNGINGATTSVNVGIGTISPTTALEVVDTNVVTSATVEGTVNVMTNRPQTIDSGGSITLGGTINDAGTTFRTFGSIEGRKANATTGNNSGYLILKTNNTGVLTERMRITSVGDVGIGTATPGGQFELSLNEGRKPTSNTWTIPSDARLKNINGIYVKGLAEILQLKPIRYNYKNTDKRTFDQKVLDKEAYGFLAQEVQPLFPEAVGIDADGYLNFDLHPILIASINAFKELNIKNNELEQENEALKIKVNQQEEIMQAILQRLNVLEKNKN